MDRWVGKTALVTGASSGIGAAIAEDLVKNGLQVVAVARRVKKIEELGRRLIGAKGILYAKKCDLSNENDILQVFAWIKKHFGGVDVLVNNAALIVPALLTDGETEGVERMMTVNVLAAAITTREAVRSMKERKFAGHIFNINSVRGHYLGGYEADYESLYPATKFALKAMTEVTRKELVLAKSKIKITSISPGIVKTEFPNASGKEFFSPELLASIPRLEAEDVAKAVNYALATPPHLQVCELLIRAVGETF
ncbi:farnesol dehydrogenase-like [Athalia rosae]|uniref:farnesol dehydrogenase-like n=1 Tax=Athalia rosae TaxID=37344 RepID=UPI0020339286|nr:farnesol dehydrogenase-like [Athalia rosae]